ncbi:hypothetical protein ACEWY4_000154 [Coilia grayii]|uniref:Major facilitator superfamily (MFS) profile domain-containing protein n=1 Tax=Coilia grayii TaxID=363190 RepID=A0ABD1KVT8_9TELE
MIDTVLDVSGTKSKASTAQTWPRPVARVWITMLLLITCLLYSARMAMPVCAVTMGTQFGWSKTDSGVVMSGFFYGYCLTQVLGGYASDRIGGERVLLLSSTGWAFVTAVTPLLAHLSISPLVTMTTARFLMGLFQGVHYPSLASVCAQRVGEGERGFVMGVIGCGSYLGVLFVGGLGSVVLELHSWEPVFTIVGLLSALWAFGVWQCLVTGYSVSVVRKLMQGCAMGLSSVFLLLCRNPSFGLTVALVSAAVGLGTFNSSGVTVNVHDLAPSCAGALYGIMNTCAAFTGILLVYFSGYLVELTQSWDVVFSVLTLVNVAGLSVFLAFGDAQRLDLELE